MEHSDSEIKKFEVVEEELGADHRKQRGRTAPNRALGAWDDKNYFEIEIKIKTEPRHRRR